MAKKVSLTPNRSAYEALLTLSKTNSEKILLLCHDASWYIVRVWDEVGGCGQGPRHEEVQETWKGWEEMNRRMSQSSLETLHKALWPDIPMGKAMKVKEALSSLIWNYRLSRAKDWTVDNIEPGAPVVRKSVIAGRTYTVTEPIAGTAPYTSKAGLACYKIIKEVCGTSGTCTEGDLKKVIVERGQEITPTHKDDPTSAWRFLQFYRPHLVAAGMLIYTK